MNYELCLQEEEELVEGCSWKVEASRDLSSSLQERQCDPKCRRLGGKKTRFKDYQILELANQDLKATIINMFEDLKRLSQWVKDKYSKRQIKTLKRTKRKCCKDIWKCICKCIWNKNSLADLIANWRRQKKLHELENGSIGIIQAKEQREKRLEKKKTMKKAWVTCGTT